MVNAIFKGSSKPATVPLERIVQIGRRSIHATHQLCIYKGLYYCTKCGYHAHAKAQKLLWPCQERSAEGVKRASRIAQGKPPSGMSRWPNDPGRAGVVELLDSDGEAV